MIADNLIEKNMLTIQFLENKIISGIFQNKNQSEYFEQIYENFTINT